VPYLAQLLAGYRHGLDHDPPESDEAVRAALAGETDAYRRGLLLGLLANFLVQSERSSSKIGERNGAATRRDRSYTNPRRSAVILPLGGHRSPAPVL
jgi:hypothetical protein